MNQDNLKYSYNLYAYCENNPVNRFDPTGEAWWNWVLSGVAVVSGVVLCATGICSGVGVGLIAGGISGLISNTMNAAGVDSKLASQISAGIDVIGGTVLLFTPFASVGASMIGSGVGSFAGGYISESLGGNYELGATIGGIGGGIIGGKIADISSTRYLNNIIKNPTAIQGQSLTKVKMASRLSSSWTTSTLTQSSRGSVGFKALSGGDRLISWSPPGSRWHFGGSAYWKVSSGVLGTLRFPY